MEPSSTSAAPWRIHVLLRLVLGAFYLYGAVVHVANMAGLSGFDWSTAPLKWQVLDVVYLVLDIGVVVGLAFRPAIGIALFAIAAISQIVLYTALRDWIIDVPAQFARSDEEVAYLSTLVIFHILTLLIVVANLAWLRWRSARAGGLKVHESELCSKGG